MVAATMMIAGSYNSYVNKMNNNSSSSCSSSLLIIIVVITNIAI